MADARPSLPTIPKLLRPRWRCSKRRAGPKMEKMTLLLMAPRRGRSAKPGRNVERAAASGPKAPAPIQETVAATASMPPMAPARMQTATTTNIMSGPTMLTDAQVLTMLTMQVPIMQVLTVPIRPIMPVMKTTSTFRQLNSSRRPRRSRVIPTWKCTPGRSSRAAAAADMDAAEDDQLIDALARVWKPVGKRAIAQAPERRTRAYLASQRPTAEEQAAKAASEAQAAADERQQREAELWASVSQLALDPQLLDRLLLYAVEAGVVAEESAIVAILLVSTSRLLVGRALCLLRRGAPASGKNFATDAILKLMPPEAIIHLNSGSAKALQYYGGEDEDALVGKVLYVPEAAGLARRGGDEPEIVTMLRSLISDGEINYSTVVVREGGLPPITVNMKKKGPTALIMTSARDNVEEEMLTRLMMADSDETPAYDQPCRLRSAQAGDRLPAARKLQHHGRRVGGLPALAGTWCPLQCRRSLRRGPACGLCDDSGAPAHPPRCRQHSWRNQGRRGRAPRAAPARSGRAHRRRAGRLRGGLPRLRSRPGGPVQAACVPRRHCPCRGAGTHQGCRGRGLAGAGGSIRCRQSGCAAALRLRHRREACRRRIASWASNSASIPSILLAVV